MKFDPHTTSTQTDCPALRLPAEVLTQLLSYVLVAEDGAEITLRGKRARRWRNELNGLQVSNEALVRPTGYGSRFDYTPAPARSAKSALLDILLVSRAFYFSGIEAYYGGNVFRFDTANQLASFVETTHVDRRRCVRDVVLSMEWSFPREVTCPSGVSDCRGIESKLIPDDQRSMATDVPANLPNLRSLGVCFRLDDHQAEHLRGFPAELHRRLGAEMERQVREAWPSKATTFRNFHFASHYASHE